VAETVSQHGGFVKFSLGEKKGQRGIRKTAESIYFTNHGLNVLSHFPENKSDPECSQLVHDCRIVDLYKKQAECPLVATRPGKFLFEL
jgi:hypothetical protein